MRPDWRLTAPGGARTLALARPAFGVVMPAPRLLSALPKPLLFALYGAVGGLLGALVFAEPLYHLLTPGPQFEVVASPEVEVFVEGQNTLLARVSRGGFDGPVVVRLEGLPPGVTADPVTVPAGQTDAEVVAVGGPNAGVVATHPAKVVAEADRGSKKLRAEAPVAFKVTNPPKPLADIVLVLDASVKMQWAFDELKAGIVKLVESLQKARIDYRIALVTFREHARRGTLVEVTQFGKEPFTADAAPLRDAIGERAKVEIGSGVNVPQPSLEALAEACKLPFRKDATKMFLLITDCPPLVRPESRIPQAVAESSALIKRSNIDSVNLVTWERDKTGHYDPLLSSGVQKAPGRFFDIADVVTGESGFAPLLDAFGAAVSEAAAAKNPELRPQAASVKSLQSGELTAAGTEKKLVARSGVWTAAIAALVCLFLLGGQHHYLKGTLPRAGGVVAGLLGGAAVGVVGGAAGQGLFFLAPDVTFLAHLFRVFGWALLGGLAGAGLALFIPNMKTLHGLAGGAVGGAAGAVGFIVVSSAAHEIVGRLVGGLVLGFCIGLMVAIAETAFRRAWLEVRYGDRERITVTLGPEPVKVGSDARACTVWARGAPPVALRFFVRDGQVICDDAVNGREAAVSDGYEKEVGTLTVTVRTGSGTAAPTAPPPRPTPAARPTKPLDDDDGFDLPMPVAPKPPVPQPKQTPATPQAAPTPKPQPQAAQPPAPPKPPAAPPPRPPVPKPALPAGTPNIKSTAKNPDACPTCGRVVSGKPGARYCMICDKTF